MYVAGYGYFSCKGTVGVVSEKSRGCEEVAESGEVYVEIAGIVDGDFAYELADLIADFYSSAIIVP